MEETLKISHYMSGPKKGKYVYVEGMTFYPRIKGNRKIRYDTKGNAYFLWHGHKTELTIDREE